MFLANEWTKYSEIDKRRYAKRVRLDVTRRELPGRGLGDSFLPSLIKIVTHFGTDSGPKLSIWAMSDETEPVPVALLAGLIC
jgi:hypothetical protein